MNCDDCKFEEECVDYGWLGCKKFTPKPHQPPTNFDRITKNEESLAEFLCELWTKDENHLCDRFESAEYEGIGGKKILVEWLKENIKCASQT